MTNETVLVLREQVARLTRERDEARIRLSVSRGCRKVAQAEVTRLTAERDEWRALATKAQDERDQWMSKAGELTEQVAELRALADKTVESFALAYGSSPYHWPEPVRGALEILRSGTSDTNPRI